MLPDLARGARRLLLGSLSRSAGGAGRLAAAALAGVAALAAAPPAGAYCRTSTTSSATFDGHVCTPPQGDDSGSPLSWGMPHVTYSIQQDATQSVPFEAMREAAREAFDAWMSADCGGAPPRIEVTEADPAACSRYEYNQKRGNANVLFFVDQGWDTDPAQLALTVVSYDVNTGEIYDADTAFNTDHWDFTTDGSSGAGVDLLSVLTHEMGHFLGLAHSPLEEATMRSSYTPPDVVDLRTLSADDRAGICAVYPPGPIADGCDGTPRHGFSPLCAADQAGPVPDEPPLDDRCCCTGDAECVDGVCAAAGCACGAAPAPRSPWPAALALAAALPALVRRRRRRS